MNELTHLSYSSIQNFLNCGENWRRKYLVKEATPTTPALLFGSAIHQTIEVQIVNRQEMIDTDMLTTWAGVWASKLRESEEKGERIDWGADEPAEIFNDGVRLLSTPDMQKLVNSIKPMVDDNGPYIERKIELRVPGVPVPVIGYIDIMTADGVPGDFKTSSRAWDQDKAREELQPIFYLAALNQADFDVPGLRFRHYVIVKGKNPKVQTLEHQHTWDEIFWLFGLIQKVWKAIEAESFNYNPHSWLCNPRYCSFWGTCRGKGL